MRLYHPRYLRLTLLAAILIILGNLTLLVVLQNRNDKTVGIIVKVNREIYTTTSYFMPGARYNRSEGPSQRNIRFGISSMRKEGEMGRPVTYEPHEEVAVKRAMELYGVNIVVSEKISLYRSLPDHRSRSCDNITYDEILPVASCVLLFRDEAISLILRTIHSIVNRSPKTLLKEIIIVDDASSHESLGEPLDSYINITWPDGLVKIKRLKTRHGLMRARNIGAKHATGDVIIIMDAHMEVTDGWLEPLLAEIKRKPKSLVVPIVPIISPSTLEYVKLPNRIIYTIFLWNMEFTWITIPDYLDERRSTTDPIRSPTMIGCIFAMNRQYFFDIGAFDEDMEIWGGENIELPLRVWMCGGEVNIIPCSRVGHVYRTKASWQWNNAADGYGRNIARVAELWLGELKELFYFYRPDLKGKLSAKSLSNRIRLKERLKCKDIRWFLKNVVPFQFIPSEHSTAYGQIINKRVRHCLHLDGLDNRHVQCSVSLKHCNTSGTAEFQNQIFALSKRGELRRELDCLEDVGEPSVVMSPCVIGNKPLGTQRWRHHKENGTILNVHTRRCLSVTGNHRGYNDLMLAACEIGDSYQSWLFQYYL